MADVAIATQLLALEMAGVNLSEQRWEKLDQYLRRVIARSSFKKIVPVKML
jgi:glutathione S-transferase